MQQGCAAVFGQLTELVERLERDESDTATGLHEVVDRAARHLAGCQYGGITVAHKGGGVASVAATH